MIRQKIDERSEEIPQNGTKDKRPKKEEYNNYISAVNLKVWIYMETKKNDLVNRLFEFGKKIRFAAREMRESNYWLRIVSRTVTNINISENKYLITESGELLNVPGSIAQKLR